LVERINKLEANNRMDDIWSYVLLGENTFNIFKDKGANAVEIFEYCKILKNELFGVLF